jgi:hypothetical protein
VALDFGDVVVTLRCWEGEIQSVARAQVPFLLALGSGRIPGMVEDLTAMIGSTLLVGVTYIAADGEVEGVFELHGRVTSVDPLVTIERDGQEDFTLPPEPEAYDHAEPGEYTLRTTGEVVVNPGYTTIWTVEASDE